MSKFDLRQWLVEAEALGQLRRITGADPHLEVGAACHLNYRRANPEALLFEDLVGYPDGGRVLAGSVINPKLMGMTLGLGGQLDDLALVDALRSKPGEWTSDAAKYRAEQVSTGPILENVLEGDDIDFRKFPAPFWHEGDGGQYIGTGCGIVTVDPETDVINMGAYRVELQDEGRAISINIEAGKHGAQHIRRWFEREGRAPIAGTFGQHPIFLMVAGTEVPFGISELDYAGAILGEAVEVIKGEDTGLPIPAYSELAFEGWMYPDRRRPEGPFGEWTGYYSGGVTEVLTVDVTRVYHRNDPINLGAPPGKPPNDYSYMRCVMKSAMATDGLIATGLPGVSGVWMHEVAGGRLLAVVSIEQRYPGHSRQAAYLAAQHPTTAYMNRFVVVVDHDVNPRDLGEVIWAMSTRCDPAKDIEIMGSTWGSRVDPLAVGGPPYFNSRAIIDACRPFERLADFPKVVTASHELLARVAERWPELRP
jgi:UbiD family decarboxylase